jgi:PAS domain S-box-containing protein
MNDTDQPSNFRVWLYAFAGFVLGLIFVALVTWVVMNQVGSPLTWESIAQLHLNQPLLWLVDLVPILLAVIFGILGGREVALIRLSHQMAKVIKQRNSEIDHLNAEVDSKSTEIVRYREDLAKQLDESQKVFTVVRQAKHEWEATFDSVADLIVLTDENGKIIRCNRATCQAFQADFSQILGMQIGELFFGSSGSGQEQFPTQRAEMKFPQLDRWYEVLSNALMMDAGQQGRIYLLRDISDRKQATLALDRQRQYYEALVKNNPIAIVTLNLDQRIVDCNPAFENLFEYPKQEVFGQDLDGLIAPPERTAESQSLSQVVRKGEVVHKITQRRRKDGSLVDVELFGIPIILWGKQIGILGLYHDLSGLIRTPEAAESSALTGAGWVAEASLAGLPAEPLETTESVEPSGLAGVPLDTSPFLDEGPVIQESQREDDLSAVEPPLEAVEAAPLPRETRRKPLQIEVIEGIGPAYAAKLAAAGVTTTAQLLHAAADRKGRQTLAEATGLSRDLILKWVNRADLMRVPGVGEEYSDLLEAAGVDTVKELRTRNPQNLHLAMTEVNADKKLVRRLPYLSEVQAWVKVAKELEPLITH